MRITLCTFVQTILLLEEPTNVCPLSACGCRLSSMPPRRSVRRPVGRRGPRSTTPPPPPPPAPLTEADIARLFSEQLAAAMPVIVSQIHSEMQSKNVDGSSSHHDQRDRTGPEPPHQGCNYKYFASCNPPTFSGKEGASGLLKWLEGMENKLKVSRCLDVHKTQYATGSLKDAALTWWNTQVRIYGTATTDVLPWDEFVALIKAEYCSANELKKLKEEF